MTHQRLLAIKNGYNFRELGGYETTTGQTIKWGRLIRSGGLGRLDNNDEQLLSNVPVTVDIDFRSKPEVAANPDQVPPTADYYNLPVFDIDVTNASRSDEEIAKKMQEVGNGFEHMKMEYGQMAKIPSAKHAYQQMFHLLLTNESGATLFHCTAGKDRTSFGAFLIMTALGVPRETIFKDYLLTNEVTAKFRDQWLKQLRNTTKNLGNLDAVVKNRGDMIAAYREYLENAIKVVDQLAGSPENYLTDYLGLSKGDITDLRRLYLD